MNTLMRAVYVAAKDLRLLLRDPAAVFWAVGFPVMYAVFFGMAFSGGGDKPKGMRVAIVDEDQTSLSRRFSAALGDKDGMTTTAMKQPAALKEVRQGRSTAAVIIRKGFGDSWGGLFPGDSNNQSSQPLEIVVDPARQMEGGVLQGQVLQAKFGVIADQVLNPEFANDMLTSAASDISSSSDIDPVTRQALLAWVASARLLMDRSTSSSFGGKALKKKLEGAFVVQQSTTSGGTGKAASGSRSGKDKGGKPAEKNPTSYFQVAFPQAMLWGLLGCVATFATSLVQERVKGTLLRLRVAPIKRSHILLGKGMACFLASQVVVILLVILGAVAFRIYVNSFSLLVLASVCLGLCFVGVMMFVSNLAKTEQGVAGGGWAIFLVMSMFGGGMIPLFLMPEWMRTVGNVSPVKWGIVALEGVYWRKFNLEEMLQPCLYLLIGGAVFFCVGLLLMNRTESKGG